jgi:hypothetical protein
MSGFNLCHEVAINIAASCNSGKDSTSVFWEVQKRSYLLIYDAYFSCITITFVLNY